MTIFCNIYCYFLYLHHIFAFALTILTFKQICIKYVNDNTKYEAFFIPNPLTTITILQYLSLTQTEKQL